ncbi:MAG TPA: Uma2 family endonuclease [Pirellulales bacterium]|nr:Uma2 family endonuclease [Pirellulales bacterium]
MIRPSLPPAALFDENRTVVLHGVAWDTYQVLRRDESNWHLRMTYDRGELELMSPSKVHARITNVFGRMIDAWCDHKKIAFEGFDPLTFQRGDLDRGLEPDRCYYIAHADAVQGDAELDLARDPPPDLALEVDIASSSERKMRLYETLGFPELWRYVGGQARVYRLGADCLYKPSEKSHALPGFPLQLAESLLDQCGTRDATSLLRSFRKQIRKDEG